MDIDITLNSDNIEENHEQFLEWRDVVKNDLKIMRYKILECEDSFSKSDLLLNIDNIIWDFSNNNCCVSPIVDIDIKAYDNYLVFSYFKYNKKLDNPSIVIITRDMKEFYFIDGVEYLKRIELYDAEVYDNIMVDEIHCFVIKQKEIKNYVVSKTGRLGDLYYDCFNRTKSFIKELI